MKTLYAKLAQTIFVTAFSVVCFGQAKTLQLPNNFVNPFNSGAIQNNVFAATPYNNNQVPSSGDKELKIEIVKGSFHFNLKKYKLTKEQVSNNFKSWLRLGDNYSFRQISERTDDLGFTHVNFQQLFNGIAVDGCMVMAHFKNGEATSINGQIAEAENITTQNSITANRALTIAKENIGVTELLNEYPIELVITGIPTKNETQFKLAYRVRIDAAQPFTMCYVFVDAVSVVVINKVNLIANADTPGTATTLYNGTQSITCDSYSGYYRLRESSRNIQTYNATNATFTTGTGFSGESDYTTSSTTWSGYPRLNSFTISNVSTSWWYASHSSQKTNFKI